MNRQATDWEMSANQISNIVQNLELSETSKVSIRKLSNRKTADGKRRFIKEGVHWWWKVSEKMANTVSHEGNSGSHSGHRGTPAEMQGGPQPAHGTRPRATETLLPRTPNGTATWGKVLALSQETEHWFPCRLTQSVVSVTQWCAWSLLVGETGRPRSRPLAMPLTSARACWLAKTLLDTWKGYLLPVATAMNLVSDSKVLKIILTNVITTLTLGEALRWLSFFVLFFGLISSFYSLS